MPFVERNLNPKAACLKRREEEKADEYSASHNVTASSEPVLHSSMVCVTTSDLLFNN